jgi:RNase P subunit RPR2
LSYNLEFEIRTDLGLPDRVEVARCEGCGYPLLLNGPIETRIRRAVETMEMGRCPRCGSEDTQPGLFSQEGSRQPLLLGQCRTCRRQFAPGMAA